MARLLSWDDLTSRPRPHASHTIKWGPGETDVADLWLPAGAGPHDLVLMVHGGCWQKAIADRTLMDWAADDMAKHGLAVWNIEYRGVDEAGGGYPGTFQDVARAADYIRTLGPQYNLRTDRVVAFGHSAGGHLATWLAARPNLPASSPLRTANPLPIHAVVNSGGLADLKASAPVTQASCLADIMDKLTGPPSASRPDVFADTSPASLAPIDAAVISVNGAQDRIAPPQLGRALAVSRASSYKEIPDAGHVELIAPGTAAFTAEVAAIKDQLRR
jgi:acetyl esterase/lipase